MKLNLIFTIVISVTFSIPASSQFSNYSSFEELDNLSRSYVQTNKLDSAILAIEYALRKFPEYDMRATLILDFLYSRTNRDSCSLKNWSYGLKKGYFYGLNNWHFENRFKNNPEFERLAKIDKQIGDSMNDLSHLKYEVVLPMNYSSQKAYPLIIVFHGNGRNLEKSKRSWTSPMMKDSFIVVYLQSYIFMNQENYKWVLNDAKTETEFREIYSSIVEKFNINKSQIIFCGMSAGGCLAIDYAFNQLVSVSGLVLNCPVIPPLTDRLITQYAIEKYKLGIITGEKDFALSKQRELISRLEKVNGQTKLIINRDLGHEFSKDFSTVLDEYLKWVIQ